MMAVTLAAAVAACSPERPAAPPDAGPTAATQQEDEWIVDDWSDWKQVDTYEKGTVEVKPDIEESQPPPGVAREPLAGPAARAGVLVLNAGGPFTAVRYEGPRGIPVNDYEISWDAMRVEGSDFFSALTFPVGSLETCASLVNGGWGGRTTGVSSIDHLFANENETTRGIEYVQGRWYRFTLQVNTQCIRLLIDGQETFAVNIQDRPISMHPSEIQKCTPLGFSTFQTTGAIRNLRIRKLAPGELTPPESPY